jgi:hypothetical protein
MRKSIAEVLSGIENYTKKNERIEYLRANDHPILRDLLKYMFIPELKFILPEGTPPYTPFEFEEPGRLWAEVRKLYLFVEGGNPNLTQVRREQLFINMLSGITAADAAVLIAVKDQSPPWKGLTRKIVEEAYPGIFQ